ncbi:MAG: response regulator transcription factor [Anaerolineae bacterium]|nr:response regulator transcription factor [Anaerolineae bacterium]
MPSNADKNVIRVITVDDHDIVLRGLAAGLALFDDINLIADASNAVQAIELCRNLRPDVLVVDLLLEQSSLSGIDVIRSVHQESANTQVIALTNYSESDLICLALEAGAISYILKNVTMDELVTAIRRAYVGQSTLAPEAAHVLMNRTVGTPRKPIALTRRERDVLQLMVKGLSNPEIANRLTISRSTVKNHVSNILAKIGASTRTEAVVITLEHNLLDVPT